MTDLWPEQAQAAWYQMRFWIEDEYKDGKRGWFHWEQTKMTKPERASRLWLVLGIARHMAIVLGSELEAREQEEQAQQRGKRKPTGPPRRRGRPALPVTRPRGREQSVLMRGVMALRAAESGGQNVLPAGQLRAEPLPKHLYPVSRVPKSYQLKKQRRAEKKRNRQRAQTRVRREQRAEARAIEQAEKLARRQERQARREARPAAKPGKRVEDRRMVTLRAEEALLLRGDTNSLQATGKPDPPGSRPLTVPLNERHSVLVSQSSGAGPLLRLSRGRLQPPPRLLRKEIPLKGDDGPPLEAGP